MQEAPVSERSIAERLALLPKDERRGVLNEVPEPDLAALADSWEWLARPKQLPPDGEWLCWVLLAGRGFGKTRAGAEWTDRRARERKRKLLIAGRTPADVRDYSLNGPGGLLTHHDDLEYEPSKRTVTWPNGSVAHIRSGANPEEFRGFGGDTAWCDEFAAWAYPEDSWNNLLYGIREGRPRIVVTTTPKPLTIIKAICAADWSCVVSGSSYENRPNLAPEWFDSVIADAEGTRLGRQEIHAEILDDVPGALWKRSWFRYVERPRSWADRLVIAVDPAATSKPESSETGIIACGAKLQATPPQGHVYGDASGRYSPREWAEEVAALYRRYEADAVVAEVNNGGDLVEENLRVAAPEIPVVQVRASRGKAVRAEPVAHLYEPREGEPGRVTHERPMHRLEDQLCTWEPGGGQASPDRMDALVWGLSELMLGETTYQPYSESFTYEEGGFPV